jgi:putative ABC transport system substrate-binding protein
MQLLPDPLPQAVTIGFLLNPGSPNVPFDVPEMQAAARVLERQLLIVKAGTEREIDTAFASILQQGAAALVVQAEPFLLSRRNQLVALAARHAIPTMNFDRAFPAAGGLISYGTDFADAHRQAGIYTGRILRGKKPADLPVMQSTKFELVVNLKTAKALGLTIPQSVLLRADEVIQ